MCHLYPYNNVKLLQKFFFTLIYIIGKFVDTLECGKPAGRPAGPVGLAGGQYVCRCFCRLAYRAEIKRINNYTGVRGYILDEVPNFLHLQIRLSQLHYITLHKIVFRVPKITRTARTLYRSNMGVQL